MFKPFILNIVGHKDLCFSNKFVILKLVYLKVLGINPWPLISKETIYKWNCFMYIIFYKLL
jgi:hypothetical protein